MALRELREVSGAAGLRGALWRVAFWISISRTRETQTRDFDVLAHWL